MTTAQSEYGQDLFWHKGSAHRDVISSRVFSYSRSLKPLTSAHSCSKSNREQVSFVDLEQLCKAGRDWSFESTQCNGPSTEPEFQQNHRHSRWKDQD